MKLLEMGVVVPFKAKNAVDDLINQPIMGNALDDADLWDKLTNYILNPKNPMRNRIAALKKIDEIVSNVQPSYSEKDVEKFVEEYYELHNKG